MKRDFGWLFVISYVLPLVVCFYMGIKTRPAPLPATGTVVIAIWEPDLQEPMEYIGESTRITVKFRSKEKCDQFVKRLSDQVYTLASMK